MKGLHKEKKDARLPEDRESSPAWFREQLLDWYRRHQRPLPWRESRDAYAVMVSEFMLQQTRVEVVEPRFKEFVQRFPTVEDLASAPREAVHDAWSGLGYYRRADLLHGAAQAITARGDFPREAEQLQALPGFGPYTSAAVASIAFEDVVPVLDGNVERVCARLLAQSGSPKRSAVRRVLMAHLREWIDPESPGDFNQAMMELGATVCRPKSPRCAACPLLVICAAHEEGRPMDYPTRQQVREREAWRWTQFVVFDGQRKAIRLARRASTGRQLAGRWELPGFRREQASRRDGKSVESRKHKSSTQREAERLGLRLGDGMGSFRHSITHRDFDVELIEARPSRNESNASHETTGDQRAVEMRWVALGDFDERGRWQGSKPLPSSSMLAKAIRLIRRSFSEDEQPTQLEL